MHRLFVALRPPPAIRAALRAEMTGVPAARWQDDEQLHVTLRFIGEVERTHAEDIAHALAGVAGDAAEVRIDGVGTFDRRGRVDTLWARLTPPETLATLHRKVDRALTLAGVEPDRRAYLPHITLARFGRHADDPAAIAHWVAAHAAFASATFFLDHLLLYESHLSPDGARYEAVARWPLRRRQVRFGCDSNDEGSGTA